jgi:hypothetical protein
MSNVYCIMYFQPAVSTNARVLPLGRPAAPGGRGRVQAVPIVHSSQSWCRNFNTRKLLSWIWICEEKKTFKLDPDPE